MKPVDLPDPDSITSKGFTLNGAMAFVVEKWGPEGKTTLLPELSEDLRRVVGGVVLSSSWYPFSHQVELYEKIDRTFGTGDLSICHDIGRFTAEYELSTVHRLFMRVARLDHWLKCASMMWRFYYSEGRLESRAEGTTCDVSVSRFHPISSAFCKDFGGWLQRTGELTGQSNVRLEHTECVLDGAPACRYRLEWSS